MEEDEEKIEQNYDPSVQQYLDTNDKQTVFGTAEDGKTIVSARKIKGELIGGYILFGILLSIVAKRVISLIILPTALSINGMTKLEEFNALVSKMSFMGLIVSLLGAALMVVTIVLASRVTFKNRKLRKEDVSSVLKVTIIYEIIVLVISLGSLYFSHIDDMKSVEKLEKTSNSLNTSYYTQSLGSDFVKGYAEVVNNFKNYYNTSFVQTIIFDIVAAGISIVVQKKILEKNAVEM